MSAGFNITPYIENGVNHIELLMGPQDSKDPKTLFPDSSCEVIFSKSNNNITDKISAYKLIVNEQGNISALKPTAENSIYDNKAVEGYTKNENDYGLYKVHGDIIIHGLPTWSWVNARPVEEHDLQEIQKSLYRICRTDKTERYCKVKRDNKNIVSGGSLYTRCFSRFHFFLHRSPGPYNG